MLRRFFTALLLLLTAATLVGAVIAWDYVRAWDAEVTERFRTQRWTFPSKIFSDGVLLYPGMDIDASGLHQRLQQIGYHPVESAVARKGEYRLDPKTSAFDIFLYDLPYPSSNGAARPIRLQLTGSVIEKIIELKTGEETFDVELGGSLLGGLYKDVWEERRVVTLDEVSPLLLRAIIDVEDQRFYQHYGVDPIGVARAVWTNLSSGVLLQGGSTLTQQLMKNLFLTSERSWQRKVREAFMALIVERRFSKDEILQRYINEIYLGQRGAQGIFGVWEASHFYFSKEPHDLTVSEMATLAGLISAPNKYSPYRNAEKAKSRRNFALLKMLEQGDIGPDQFEAARQEPLITAAPKIRTHAAPYFVDFVRNELNQTYAGSVLTDEGLTIHTSLDPYLQHVAEDVVSRGIADLEKRYARLRSADPKTQLQTCLVVIEPQTGAIKAMIGGRGYRQTQFNRCTQARRQPGSVFKPFTFIAAFEQSRNGGDVITPTSRIEDAPFTWSFDQRRQSWTPANYKKQYYGTVTARVALEKSLNAATTRLAHEVGLSSIIEVAHRMGIESPLPPYPSIVLGSAEVTPFEVAKAFSVLANAGLQATPVSIRKVFNRDGAPIERHPIEVQQIIAPETAYLVTHLMEGVLQRGTARSAKQLGFNRPAAGKTGTTDDYRDAWFVGFTPNLLTVVWVGFDHRADLNLSGSEAALPMWVDFMKRATAGQPELAFVPPPGAVTVRIDPESGQLATEDCPRSYEEAFYEGQQPTTPCPLHSRWQWDVPAEPEWDGAPEPEPAAAEDVDIDAL
ncbi:MAG TPA: PBP1A family penicillin-binding protein [Terriglobales bacterium]|nr:PBP1A family penicillin-binding protein [Terriglobales bacterium]